MNLFPTMPGLLTPEDQKQVQMQGLLGLASGLLDASGPSPVRKSLGQGISAGLTTGMAAMNNAQQQAMQRQMFGMQKDDLAFRRAQAEQKASEPLVVNGVVLDRTTLKPLADMRQQPNPGQFEVKLRELRKANPGWSDSQVVEAALAPSTVINNTGPTPQTEEQKAIGKFYADQFAGISKAADSARDQIGALDQFESGNFETGPFAGTRVLLGRVAQFFGVSPDEIGVENIADAEAMRAVSNKLAKSMRVQGEGVMSDADLRLLLDSVVNIDNTPGGNAKLAYAMRKVAERTIKKEEMAQAFYDNNNQTMRGFSAHWNKYERENPLFQKGELESIGKVQTIPVVGGGADDLKAKYGLD